MIRNRRHDTGIEWTKRICSKPFRLNFRQKNASYTMRLRLLKEYGLHPSSAFSILTLQREACSSREAVYMTLKNMLESQEDPNSALTEHMITPLMELLQQVPQNAKAEKVLELVQKIDDKVIIFTEYRATQLYLQWYLKQHGITSVPFRGGFKRGKKDWMKQLFESHAQVFIATEAGGEGINLQFCHHIINYDLPWNPMRLEQRIGRVHRLGQKHDVHIYNLAIQHTVEEHILKLLYEKINLFERVVGELDDILTKLDLKNIEEHIQDILFHSRSEGEIKIKMENLTSIIQYEDSEEDQHAAN